MRILYVRAHSVLPHFGMVGFFYCLETGVTVCGDWCSSSCRRLLRHLWVLGSCHLFQGLELKDRKQTSVFSSAQLVWHLLCCYFSFPIFFVGRVFSSLIALHLKEGLLLLPNVAL